MKWTRYSSSEYYSITRKVVALSTGYGRFMRSCHAWHPHRDHIIHAWDDMSHATDANVHCRTRRESGAFLGPRFSAPLISACTDTSTHASVWNLQHLASWPHTAREQSLLTGHSLVLFAMWHVGYSCGLATPFISFFLCRGRNKITTCTGATKIPRVPSSSQSELYGSKSWILALSLLVGIVLRRTTECCQLLKRRKKQQ